MAFYFFSFFPLIVPTHVRKHTEENNSPADKELSLDSIHSQLCFQNHVLGTSKAANGRVDVVGISGGEGRPRPLACGSLFSTTFSIQIFKLGKCPCPLKDLATQAGVRYGFGQVWKPQYLISKMSVMKPEPSSQMSAINSTILIARR